MNPADITRLNNLNSGLMLIAGVLAFALPFPVFLLAYALLGPLHYLTEISWLHDRKYFSHGRYGYALLLALAVVACYPAELGLESWIARHNPVWLALVAAAVMSFVRPLWARVLIITASLLMFGPMNTPALYFLIGLYLPTLIHVFVFTWLFVLLGALKSRSISGFVSLAVMTGVALLELFLPTSGTAQLSPYVAESMAAFGDLHRIFAQHLGWDPDSEALVRAMRFIAFAYTYHYLNWFSKTRLIQWHRISRSRLIAIAVAWIGSVAIYAWDYELGLQLLFLLSMAHVLLEFPLNLQSLRGIGQESWRWYAGAKPVAAPAPANKPRIKRRR